MTQYKCSLCGWIYDSEKGDEAHGIEAGTLFENLPDNWRCPMCGATKDMFKPIV